ncbi:MAG TPA: hypothetical protein VGW38_26445 [Chloroflexota bacterium]|nr:hypothetical protein [Chloroflexota bacterium]
MKLDGVAGGSHTDALAVRLRPVLIERTTVGAPPPEPGQGVNQHTGTPGVTAKNECGRLKAQAERSMAHHNRKELE